MGKQIKADLGRCACNVWLRGQWRERLLCGQSMCLVPVFLRRCPFVPGIRAQGGGGCVVDRHGGFDIEQFKRVAGARWRVEGGRLTVGKALEGRAQGSTRCRRVIKYAQVMLCKALGRAQTFLNLYKSEWKTGNVPLLCGTSPTLFQCTLGNQR